MTFPEFTGERYIPGQGGSQLAYEHLHRYLFALRWAKGKQVLDVATGAGYGAALLAPVARSVWALELDGSVLVHARRTCDAANLLFLQADATRIPLPAGSMDLVVAMEIIEHVADQEGLVRELARVARPEGLILISTPNRASYSDARQYRNPFHVREFYRAEFLALLGRYFAHVQLMNQQVRAGSLISCDADPFAGRVSDPAPDRGPELQNRAEGYEVITEPLLVEAAAVAEPMYFLALCRQGVPTGRSPAGSAFLDVSDALLQEWGQRLGNAIEEIERLNGKIQALGKWGRDLAAQLEEKNESLLRVLEEVGARDQTIRSLQDEMRSETARRDAALTQLQREFEDRTRWVMDLQRELARRDEQLRTANKLADERDEEIHRLARELARIRHALLYRVLCRLGALPR